MKKVVQTGPEFVIEVVDNLDDDAQGLLMPVSDTTTYIPGKDLPLEQTIANMSAILAGLGMKIEIASWRNIVPNVWSLHVRDAQSPMCFTNGKGSTKEAALASALGEFIERLNCNFFYNDQFWGEDIANAAFVHYPNEQWFKPGPKDALPSEILDENCLEIYNPDGELRGSHLYDTNSGNTARGICSLPFVRQSDQEVVYFPSNLIENLFLSNGMSAGNTLAEAQVQCLSEIFERAVKREILDDYTRAIYDADGELRGSHLIDTNSGNIERGICALPYTRRSDGATVYFPSNLVENLYVSNGMSAGNTLVEAQVQCLSEIFERCLLYTSDAADE